MVLPDKINPEYGLPPSLLVEVPKEVAVKLCSAVKFCAVTLPIGIKPRPATSAGRRKIVVFISQAVLEFVCLLADFLPRGKKSFTNRDASQLAIGNSQSASTRQDRCWRSRSCLAARVGENARL